VFGIGGIRRSAGLTRWRATKPQRTRRRRYDNVLTVAWDGDHLQEVRLRLAVEGRAAGRELAVRRKGGGGLTANARRFSRRRQLPSHVQSQLQPLHELRVPITQAIIGEHKWMRSGTRRELGPSAAASAAG
jgi:hypothetical protein